MKVYSQTILKALLKRRLGRPSISADSDQSERQIIIHLNGYLFYFFCHAVVYGQLLLLQNQSAYQVQRYLLMRLGPGLDK